MKSDPRIDGYIDRAAPFARLILVHLRDLVGKTINGASLTSSIAAAFFAAWQPTGAKREEGKRLNWKYERC